jgi:hypothetical protein
MTRGQFRGTSEELTDEQQRFDHMRDAAMSLEFSPVAEISSAGGRAEAVNLDVAECDDQMRAAMSWRPAMRVCATGSPDLLDNHLVQPRVRQGYHGKALARSSPSVRAALAARDPGRRRWTRSAP